MFGMFKRKTRALPRNAIADAFTYKSSGAPWPGMQTVAFVGRKKMFKFVLPLFVFALLGCSYALPVDEREKPPVVEILSSKLEHKQEGGYDLAYSTADGTSRDETAELQNKGTKDEALEVSGSYTYINEDGEEVVVTYTAGVNGFVPRSTIINPKITEVAEAAQFLPRAEPEIEA